jgi:hypothetical protein
MYKTMQITAILGAYKSVARFGILLFAGFVLTNQSHAQTTLGLGDLAFVHFDRQNTPKQFSFIARKQIDAGTVFFITNNNWSNSNNIFSASATGQSIIKVEVDQPLAPGEPFSINYGSGTVSSNTVSASFSEGSDFVFQSSGDKIWVYQATNLSTPRAATQFITGILWRGLGNPSSVIVPTTLTGTVFIFDLDIPGQSEKCACIRDNLSNYPLSDIGFLYDKANWATTTSNTTAFPCSPLSFFANFTTNISFDRYRFGVAPDNKGASGAWRQETATGTSWTTTLSGSSPDWGIETAVRRVEIYENFSLDVSNPAYPLFQCSELYVHSGVTLTLQPGVILSVGMNLINQGVIRMETGVINNDARFAQIAPTNAELNGVFEYNVLIQNREWHHMMSPISTNLNDVSFFNADAQGQATTGNSYTFQYAGPTANIFRWDAADAAWKLTSGGTADFSAEPYTIFFPETALPLVMRVSGTIATSDPNVDIQKGAQNGQGNSTSPGFGAPGWRGSNYDGWNFYGNPYLSFISTQRTVDKYSNDMSDINHNVYAYQPFNNSNVNVAGNYFNHNGSTGAGQANNIPPFQAFFMQHINPASNGNSQGSQNGSNGLKMSKRSRLSSNPGANQFIQFRGTSNAPPVLSLELFTSGNAPSNTLYLDLRADMLQPGKNAYKDGVFNGDVHSMFGIYHDSMCYTIKAVPNHLDSMHQKVAVVHHGHNKLFSISNHPDFDTDYESFLFDRYTNTMHNLSLSSYGFHNDTTQMDYRFDWFLAPKNLGIFSAFETPVRSWVWWSSVDNREVALFTEASRQNEEGHVMVYDLNGKKIFEGFGIIHQMRIPSNGAAKQAIVVINRQKAIKIQFP